MGRFLTTILVKSNCLVRQRAGMELVQVAIMVAIAVALGLIFRTQITDFVNRTFDGLSNF